MPRRKRRVKKQEVEEEEEEEEEDVRRPPPDSPVTPTRSVQSEGNNNNSNDEGQDEEDEDDGTFRCMISSDNHLGYMERDPIRGLDSFCAFEEMLYLAKRSKCDCVLLGGDLFHENKPSRRTLFKTMEILKRYVLGPNPVKIQIVSQNNFSSSGVCPDPLPNKQSSQRSSQRQDENDDENDDDEEEDEEQDKKKTKKSTKPKPTIANTWGQANYLSQFISVDLPIFSIHGNHDDPTRDCGDLLAALDLLATSQLVNYFGRQDQVDQVEISPILIQKSAGVNIAVYGLGHLRDERLNRMWTNQKVRFLRPSSDSGNWFHVFVLHQNRDLGRGTKNHVHEGMIPEWMDLVIWGHEHECQILPQESVVGTFRIVQPGSSVATSLSVGEAVRKHVGLLEIRSGSQFRLKAIPLTQVRAFLSNELRLSDFSVDSKRRAIDDDEPTLDPEDPKIDDKIGEILENQVKVMIHDARQTYKELLEAAIKEGNDVEKLAISQKISCPDQVLVRLKVEHSGFSTLNNQRFGSRFVSQVGNPSDILLFYRKKEPNKDAGRNKKNAKSKTGASLLQQPLAPQDLEETNVEDLVKENIEFSDKKLQVLEEQKLGLALDNFVSKDEKNSIWQASEGMLENKLEYLIERKKRKDSDSEDGSESEEEEDKASRKRKTTKKNKRTMDESDVEDSPPPRSRNNNGKKRSRQRRGDDSDDDDDDNASTRRKRTTTQKSRSRKVVVLSDDDDDDEEESPPPKKRATKGRSRKVEASSDEESPPPKKRATKSRSRKVEVLSDDDDDDMVAPVPKSKAKTARGRRGAATKKPKYVDDNDDDEIEDEEESEAEIPLNEEEDDVLEMDEDDDEVGELPSRRRRAGWSQSKRASQLSVARKPTKSRSRIKDNNDEDEFGESFSADEDWGTARTKTAASASMSSRRRRR